jgi:hypothetical protein
MKGLLFILTFFTLLLGCGTKHKLEGTATVQVKPPETPIVIRHEIMIDEELFRESCEKAYGEDLDKVEKCVEQKMNTVFSLVETLNKQEKKEKE